MLLVIWLEYLKQLILDMLLLLEIVLHGVVQLLKMLYNFQSILFLLKMIHMILEEQVVLDGTLCISKKYLYLVIQYLPDPLKL